MLVAGVGVGELVSEAQARAVRVRFEVDRHARAARRDRRTADESIREHDPLRGPHFQHFTRDLDTVGMADQHLPAGAGVDGRAGAPPGGPFRRVREEVEDRRRPGADDEIPFERVGERDHDFPFLAERERRRGRGPRRASFSSALSLSFHSASFHIASSMAPTGPSASWLTR